MIRFALAALCTIAVVASACSPSSPTPADGSRPDTNAADAGADGSVDSALDVAREAGFASNCTGPYREVERASFVASPPSAYVTAPVLAEGSLWFSVERAENTGTGSYDGRVVVASGWGRSPAVGFATAMLPRGVEHVRFARANNGAPIAGMNRLYDPRSGAAWQTGGDEFLRSPALVALPAMTLIIRGERATNRLFVDQFAPMNAAPAAPPTRLGSVELPAFAVTDAETIGYRLYRAPNGERTFVVLDRYSDLSSVRTLDATNRPVSDALPSIPWNDSSLSHNSAAIATNAGLWLLEHDRTEVGHNHALHNIQNDGRDRVVLRFSTDNNVMSAAELQSASDELLVLRANAGIELLDPRTGAVLQRFDDAFSAAIEGDSLFLVKGGSSMANAEIIVRRMVCN